MARLRFRVHAILQMEERGLPWRTFTLPSATARTSNPGPMNQPYPARLILGTCRLGFLHVAVRDNIDDDEIVIETAYQPDPALWEPDLKRRRRKGR